MLKNGSVISERYEVLERVGTGGMSDVYKAFDRKLSRNVAIKVLKREYNNDRSFISKFKTEAQSAASLIHPNIVNVYDVGEDNGYYYIVMELIEGITLKSYIQKKGKLAVPEATNIAIQIANGIECAHNNQIVHRDIKPQNILISREGKVKVADFGIARAASSNTMSGTAMGSVHYISPEQAGGQYVDEKSDIYSLGITFFEMITGQVPFDGDSTVSIALMHIQNKVPSVRDYVPDVPISTEKIIEKCTQTKVDARYPRIGLLISDLTRSLETPDEDFVQMDNVEDTGSTIMIGPGVADKVPDGRVVIPNQSDDEDDIDIVNPKMEQVKTYVGIGVGVLALIVVAIVVTAFIFGGDKRPSGVEELQQVTQDPTKSTVPNLIGLSKEEAQAALNKVNLGMNPNVVMEFSNDYPRDYVIGQSVDPGTTVDKNSMITLTMSKGPERINVPTNLVNNDLNDVTQKLEDVGLTWKIRYKYSPKEIGTVIACSPGEKALVTKNDVIKLVVSRGQKTDGLDKVAKVPDVVGMSKARAQAAIRTAGFSVGEIKVVNDKKAKKDTVLRQYIKAGTSAPLGTTIGLSVAKGKEVTTTVGTYTGTASFSMEDLLDDSGNPLEKGSVTVTLDGKNQTIPAKYRKLENWPGDLILKFKNRGKGKKTCELSVNGKVVAKRTVRFK